MPDVNVKGRYRIYTHDGVEPLPFTSYSNSLCSIRRPNPNTFITISTYIPGSLSPFTTFDPGSSYTIVTKSNTADFSMGPYTRADRLPSSITFKSPNFYHGLDKNSITVALSSYALSVNSPLSSVFTYIPNQDGYFVNSISFDTERLKEGLPSFLTHLTPNSSYQFKTRTPFTFFAPLQSEMGDAFAIGNNTSGQYGMGHRYNNSSLPGENIYGVWDKIVSNNYSYNCTDNNQIIKAPSLAALSSCGTTKALFVLGNNANGQLGTGSTKQYYATWTRVPGQWQDVYLSIYHMLAINSAGHLYACGNNDYGQLGLGSGTLSANTLTLVDNTRSYIELAAWSSCTMVRDSNGFIYACGRNDTGQLCINNNTSPVYTLTQEASGLSWSSVKASSRGYFVAISNKKLYGSPMYDTFYWGGGLPNPNYAKYTFAQERLSLSDVLETYISYYGTIIRRQNQNKLFAAGFDGGSTRRYLALLSGSTQGYFIESSVPSNATLVAPGDGKFTSINYYYVFYDKLHYKAPDSRFQGFIQTDITPFNIFSGIRDTPTFILSAINGLRPTPTPTITPSSTPSPVPFAPYNVLEVGIFGQKFASSRTQLLASNTPGNLSNDFTLQIINDGNVPPDICNYSTFDYEKTTSLNNIVGIAIATALNNPRYIYRKVGNIWSYTLLPSTLDATSSSQYKYRGPETGTDSLLITPPHPNYSSSQGIYHLMFIRDQSFKEAISYDRGITWQISNFIGFNSEYQFSLLGLRYKIFYSRTRGTNYEVQAVGFSGEATMGGNILPSRSLYFSRRFPQSSSPELIFNFNNTNNRAIYGFDFKHDYFNTPTVVSVGINISYLGVIYLHRRINNTWQTTTIKDNISNLVIGPTYNQPDGSLSFYYRINSPIMSIEFDPTNADLVYIAYLKHVLAYAYGEESPGYINVMCYNMKTNTIVFDEAVVRSYYEVSGSLHKSRASMVDIPSLFFDTSDNTLNLFFFGPEYTPVAEDLDYVSYKMRRNGTNNWTAPTDLFPHTRINQDRLNYLANSRELKTKY